jgi:hypothetical protein
MVLNSTHAVSIKDNPRGSPGNPAEKRAARTQIGAYGRVPPARRNWTWSPAERRATGPWHHRGPPGRGLRRRGTTVPAPAQPYGLPIYATVKVHRDHHIEVARALYSAPGRLIGSPVAVPADRHMVRIFSRGILVKIHPRQQPGRRSTDSEDLPAEKTVYAMRDLARLQSMAAGQARPSAPTPPPCSTSRCPGRGYVDRAPPPPPCRTGRYPRATLNLAA